jgi:hypothetical protein
MNVGSDASDTPAGSATISASATTSASALTVTSSVEVDLPTPAMDEVVVDDMQTSRSASHNSQALEQAVLATPGQSEDTQSWIQRAVQVMSHYYCTGDVSINLSQVLQEVSPFDTNPITVQMCDLDEQCHACGLCALAKLSDQIRFKLGGSMALDGQQDAHEYATELINQLTQLNNIRDDGQSVDRPGEHTTAMRRFFLLGGVLCQDVSRVLDRVQY